MATPNFSTILDESPSEVAPIKLLPIGTYLCLVTGEPRYDKTPRTGTEYVEFSFKVQAAEEDVDPDDLELYGDISNKVLKTKFWLTEDAIRMLDQFHENCGLDLSEQMSRRQRNEEVMNSEILVYVTHRPANDGTDRVYEEVKRITKAS